MSTPAFAWPEGRRVAVIISVLLETWSEGKAPSYFPRTTPNKPGIPDIAGIKLVPLLIPSWVIWLMAF